MPLDFRGLFTLGTPPATTNSSWQRTLDSAFQRGIPLARVYAPSVCGYSASSFSGAKLGIFVNCSNVQNMRNYVLFAARGGGGDVLKLFTTAS